MIIILGLDGLDYNYVKKFNCQNLMQKNFGMTDLSEFEEPRTIVIWSSFLAGRNLEKRILEKDTLWTFKLNLKETFFSHFENHKAIDVPGYSYIKKNHEKERKLLKAYFKDEANQKAILEDYDKIAFENHKKVKEQFFKELNKNCDLLMGYFALADVIGHLSFGVTSKMKLIYQELDEIARQVQSKTNNPILVISDHGMRPIGRFGDHSKNGFWSLNIDSNLKNPKPTQFYDLIVKNFKEEKIKERLRGLGYLD